MTAEPRLEALIRRVIARSFLAMAAVVAAAAFAGASPTLAQEPKSAAEARVIVFGEGSASVTPDYAQIRSGVTSNGKTAKEATDANSKLIAAVTAALLNSGVEQKDIRTSRFSVQPLYVHQQNAEPKFSGFSATNQLTVTILRSPNSAIFSTGWSQPARPTSARSNFCNPIPRRRSTGRGKPRLPTRGTRRKSMHRPRA